MDPARLNEHSEACVPAFALVGTGPDPTLPGSYAPLEVRWGERHWPLPSPGETVAQRFTCLDAVGTGMLDDEGCPVRASGRSPAVAIEVFKAAGIVMITDRRVVGILISGQWALGSIDGESGRVLVFSVAFEEVREISLVRERRRLGVKPRNLTFSLRDAGLVVLDLDRALDEQRYAKRFDYGALLDQITSLATARLRPGSDAARLAVLDDTAAGARREDDLTLTAVLSADGDPGVATLSEDAEDDELAPTPEPPAAVPDQPTRWAPTEVAGACPSCGTQSRSGAKFCHECGHALT